MKVVAASNPSSLSAHFCESPLPRSGAGHTCLSFLPCCLPVMQSPYHCNLLIAGFDAGPGASLYWVDYLATLHKVNTGGTGYGEAGWGCMLRVQHTQLSPVHLLHITDFLCVAGAAVNN